ncbi:MAG: ferritin [Armatimonadota bacterium]
MIDPKMEQAMNDQINEEMYSAYLYQSMAAYFADENLDGFATWMTAQAQEEMIHAMKFYNHILERGGRVRLQAIAEPPADFESTLSVFEAAFEHEQHITGCINDLMDLAHELKDYASMPMLSWFVEEQVEEEDSADEMVQKVKMVADTGNGVYMLDKEVGQRPVPFTMPAGEEG